MDILSLLRSDNIWSVPIRGIIWLIAVMIFAAGLDKGKKEAAIKADAGWFFLFLFGIGILSYLLFGFVPTF